MTHVPQPKDWTAIEFGTPEFPKLYDFGDPRSNVQSIRDLAAATRKSLETGKGPAPYEESHRQYALWRRATNISLGAPATYIRLRSARDVEKMREWSSYLLEVGIEPHRYLKRFIKLLESMKAFNTGKLSIAYLLNDGVMSDLFARIQAENAGWTQSPPAQKHDRLHSYDASSGVDPRVRQTLGAANIEHSHFTDTDLMSIIEAAKTMARGSASFIPRAYRTSAMALQELYAGGAE